MKPNYLKESCRISLVAPSFGCTMPKYKKRLKKAIQTLEENGAIIDQGQNIWINEGKVASNSPEERAKEIHNAFLSDAEAVISVGGGELMCEMMPYIDFEIIKSHPKWFVGFSDNTNLTYTITTICDMETIYGCNAPSYCNMEYDSLDTWNMLHGKKEFKGYRKWQYEGDENPLAPYHFDKKTRIKAFQYETPVTGRLLGGCLDCLTNLCGTKLDHTVEYIHRHKEDGIIFFMECCNYNSISLRRSLLQLKQAGWFDQVDMFVIGRSLNIKDKSFGITMEESYKDILLEFGKPILFNVDLGHLSPSMPMRTGAIATVEYKKNNIFITYKD